MIKPLKLFLPASLLSFVSPIATALNTTLFVDTHSMSFSEIAPIKQLVENLEGPMIDSGEIAFSTNQITYGQWFNIRPLKAEIALAFFNRVDYALNFTPDTAYIIYADENNIPLDANRSKNVFLHANHIEGHGVSFIYNGKQIENFEYSFGFSYLYASKMIYGKLQGDITTLDADTQGDLLLDYHYSEDVFFDRKSESMSSQGYTVDLSAVWNPTYRFEVAFFAKDLVSKIPWSNQQQTIATATSDRLQQTSQGDASVRAALSWQETNSLVTQKLPKQFTLNGRYALSRFDSIVTNQFVYDGYDFHRIGYRRKFWSDSHFSTYYDIGTEAVSVEVKLPYIAFGLISDSLDLDKAKVFGFQLDLAAPLSF